MDYIGNPQTLRRHLNAYAYHADTPPEIAEKLQTIPGVDADILSQAPEILYSHYDLLSDQGKTVLAQITDYGVSQHWTTLNQDGRWEKIRDRVRFELGEDVEEIPVADMPEPRTTLREDAIDWRKPTEDAEAAPESKG